jgi:hypothetical protein
MSITTAISCGLLILITFAMLVICVRSASLPAAMRRSSWGRVTLALYLSCVLGALLIGGQDAEGVGIATILLGLPSSALSAFVLNELLQLRTGLFGARWETTITLLSIGAIGINSWLVYQLGQRLRALWTSSAGRSNG